MVTPAIGPRARSVWTASRRAGDSGWPWPGSCWRNRLSVMMIVLVLMVVVPSGPRQPEAKHASAARRVANVDLAAVIAHDLPHERQAEARALLAGREERREDLLPQLGRNAGAIVADLDLHAIAVRGRAHHDAPRARRRDGVAGQVEQNAPQLHRVRPGRDPVLDVDGDRRAPRNSGQLTDLLEQRPQRDCLHAGRRPPRE